MAQTGEACKETSFRGLCPAFEDVYFSRLTCYRDGYSPRRSFSCRTCCRSCVESRCAATQGSSLYLQSKESSDDGSFQLKRIPLCHVRQGWGGFSSHHRSRCRRLGVSERHSGRRDNASLQLSLRKTDFILTHLYTETLVEFSVSAPSA